MHDIDDEAHSELVNLRTNGSLPFSGVVYRADCSPTKLQIESIFVELVRALTAQPNRNLADGLSSNEVLAFSRKIIGGKNLIVRTSWLSAGFTNEPSFLQNAPVELKIAYAIICEINIETESYTFVQRLHFSDPIPLYATDLQTAAVEIPFRRMVESIAGVDTRFETIRMKYMTVSKFETRGKTLESFNVANSLSPAGISRAIATRVKVADIKNGLGTSRAAISASSNRITLGFNGLSLAAWEQTAALLVHAIHVKSDETGVLSKFAQEKSSLTGAIPTSILFDVHAIESLLEKVGPKQLTLPGKAHDEILAAVLTHFAEPFSVSQRGGVGGYFCTTTNLFLPEVKVTPHVKTCSITLPGCSIQYDGESIARIIDREKAFRVVFDDPTLFYSKEGLYGISDLREAGKILKNIFIPQPSLRSASSEKGAPTVLNLRHHRNSTFEIIHDHIASGAKYVICDDSEQEWGDFFSLRYLNDQPIATWYHAKMGRRADGTSIGNSRSSSGASSLQVVVAQALKNLGRARIAADNGDFKDKLKFWEEPYVLPEGKVQTGIERFSSPIQNQTLRTFSNAWARALLHPNMVPEAAIVVPEYKLSMLERIVTRVGTSAASDTDLQVFYLLSAFMGGCIEMGVRPIVYCRD